MLIGNPLDTSHECDNIKVSFIKITPHPDILL